MSQAFFTDGQPRQFRSCGVRKPGRGLEIVGIVFAFFYFWPLAAAYVVWKMLGYPVPAGLRDAVERGFDAPFSFVGGRSASWRPSGFGATGNRAFDEYRRAEIERLQQERRRIDEEARAFHDFVEDLKRAKDREEFDAFMAKRRAG